MAFGAETAKLIVDLSLGGNFTKQLKSAQTSLGKFDKSASRSFRAGQQIGTGIKRGAILAAAGVGALVTQIGFGLDQLIELESLNAQTVAGLKSTASASGQTAESIRALAEKYESLNATIDDKVIQSGENLLLTFTAVRKEAFEPALLAALNMTKALGKPLETNILAVGKALQDPVKGVTALGRAGVDVRALKPQIDDIMALTKEEAKRFVELGKNDKKAAKRYLDNLRQNKVLAAQKLILAELGKEFGGRFAAGAGTVEERVAAFGDAIEDVQKNLASAFLPVVSNVATELQKLLQDPETLKAVTAFSEDIAKLFSPENIRSGIGLLKDGFGALKAIAGPIAEVVGTVAKAFAALPAPLQQALVGGFVVNKLTGGLVTNIFGGIAEAIAKSFIRAPLVNVQGGVVNVGGGLPGGGGGGLPLGGVPGAAAGAGGLTAGAAVLTVGTLILAPAAVAGLGIAITNAIDPTHERSKTGRAETARARGVPDSNNRNLRDVGRTLDRPSTVGPAVAAAVEKARAESEKTTTAVETMKGKMAADLADQTHAISIAGMDGVAASKEAGQQTATAALAAGQNVASAIRSMPPPIVNVNVTPTTINHTTTVMNRYGPDGASRNSNGGNWGDPDRPR